LEVKKKNGSAGVYWIHGICSGRVRDGAQGNGRS
jgi:hypothetical protein